MQCLTQLCFLASAAEASKALIRGKETKVDSFKGRNHEENLFVRTLSFMRERLDRSPIHQSHDPGGVSASPSAGGDPGIGEAGDARSPEESAWLGSPRGSRSNMHPHSC